jgi:hypothetical protein
MSDYMISLSVDHISRIVRIVNCHAQLSCRHRLNLQQPLSPDNFKHLRISAGRLWRGR